MSQNSDIRNGWYRHPIVAIAFGVCLGLGLWYLVHYVFGFMLQSSSQRMAIELLVYAPSGFMVGMLTRRFGAVWAVIAGLIVTSIIWLPGISYSDYPVLIFIYMTGLSILPSAISGFLGSLMSRAGLKTQLVSAGILIIIFLAVLIIPWIQVNRNIQEFKTKGVADLERLISENLVRLPSDLEWNIERSPLTSDVNINTNRKDVDISIWAADYGRKIRSLNYMYIPPKSVELESEEQARAYLMKLGVNQKLIDSLEPKKSPRSRKKYSLHPKQSAPKDTVNMVIVAEMMKAPYFEANQPIESSPIPVVNKSPRGLPSDYYFKRGEGLIRLRVYENGFLMIRVHEYR